jgi:hypothetical protein
MKFINRFINVKMGLAGALIMGGIVWLINMSHGWWPATTAALKQAAYTFLLGGILIKILDTIAVKIKNKYLAITLATLMVSVVTIILVYIVHNMRGTPRPFESTLPTVIMAPPGFLALAIRKRMRR